MSDILSVTNLSKVYSSGDNQLAVLENVEFTVRSGETLAIVGSSGSGKTTLLGLSAGLDIPSTGEVTLTGKKLSQLTEDGRAKLRNEKVGFIFQNFQLMSTLTALENVMLPLELLGRSDAKTIALGLLDRVGLAERKHHYPSQLSGGEQQRVSIARAFSNKPAILFADEPTGNLDDETSESIERLIFALNEEEGTTLIIVTHDLELAKKADRIIRLKGGHIISDERNAQQN